MRHQSGEEAHTADREWVLDAVPSVSRTFALSIDLLAEPMASWVATGYLLCRTADTIEDDAELLPRERASLLERFESTLDPTTDADVDRFLAAVADVRPDPSGPDWAVLGQTDRVIRVLHSFEPTVQKAMRRVTREMATGMADVLTRHADSGGLRLSTVDELEQYCWYVAGTVGELFTGLVDCYTGGGFLGTDSSPTPDPADARSFALLLQLVNVAKDVRADCNEENNVYLPGEWLAEEGLDHDDVVDPDETAAVARVVRRVVDHAAANADGARRYLRTIPNESGLLAAATLPYLLALGTIRELRGRTTDAVEHADAVKLERSEVVGLSERMGDELTQADVTDIAATVRHEPYEY